MKLPEPNEGAEVTQLRVKLSAALDGACVLGAAIGCGRSGVVFKARNVATKRDIALKVAWDDPAARAQLARETSLTSEIVHHNVLPTQKLYLGKPIYVVEMPLATGGTLDRLFDKVGGRPVPFPHVLGIVRQVANALEHAHSLGILHGSLCPEKILLDENGQCLVPDFGLRYPAHANDPVRPSELAFPAYAPLEQRHDSAKVDGRIDQYALAIIAYELLLGHRTWHLGADGVLEVDPLEIMVGRPIAQGVPLAAGAAIRRATSRDPAHRYPSIALFARAFAGEETIIVVTPGKPGRRLVGARPRRAWLAVPAVLSLALFLSLPWARNAIRGLWSGGETGGDLEGSTVSATGEASIETGVIRVTLSGGSSAFVVIDGQTRGGTPLSWRTNSGRHVVTLRGENSYSPRSVTVELAGGDTARAAFVVRR